MGRLWNGNPSGDLTKALSTFEAVAPGFNNPLSLTFRSLNNVELVLPPKAGHAEYGFIHHIGDLVIGHPEIYSRIGGRGAQVFNHWVHCFAISRRKLPWVREY